MQRNALILGIILLLVVSIVSPLSVGLDIDNETNEFCYPCQTPNLQESIPLTTPHHNYSTYSGNSFSTGLWDYTHTIEDIGTPFTIANKWGEYVTFEIHTLTQGTLRHRVYITVWCEGELYDDWVSDYFVLPRINGLNIYPYHITKIHDTNRLNFTVETGHIELLKRVRDDYQEFSIPIGKTGAVPDQICSLVQRNRYVEMVMQTSPLFQEFTSNISGLLHSIDLKPPLFNPDIGHVGCGPNCSMKIMIMEWFDGWRNIPWNTTLFQPYIIGETIAQWPGSEFPFAYWTTADFTTQNIVLERNHRYIMLLTGNNWSDECANQGFLCLGFTVSPKIGYPNELGLNGFWNGFDNVWMTWPSSEGDNLFRIWVSKPESNSPPQTPLQISGTTNGEKGVTYYYSANTIDPEDNPISYLFNWGDGTDTGWLNLTESGKDIVASHKWSKRGTYNVRVKARDCYHEETDWTTMEITMPLKQKIILFRLLLNQFPRLTRLLKY